MAGINALASANRRLSRSVLVGLALLAVIAIVGPVVSYTADVAEARAQFRARLSSEAELHADSLALHLSMLQSELKRIASRPEVDPGDSTTAPEQLLLSVSHRRSALFKRGVALLTTGGKPVWAEPVGEFPAGASVASSRWFQKMLASQDAVIDSFPQHDGVLVMAVPILRANTLIGAVAGLIDISRWALDAQLGESFMVVAPSGQILLPNSPPRWAEGLDVRQRLAELFSSPPQEAAELGSQHVLAVAAITGTGYAAVLAMDEHSAMAGIRSRFLHQLIFIASIHLATLALFTAYLRRSYRSFQAVEARALENDKMAALGSAASLIAHEVKNALNGLKAAATLLQTGGDAVLANRSIGSLVDRLSHLSRSLLYFGKPSPPRPMPVRLDELAREAADGLAVLPEAGEVQLSIHSDTPVAVHADGPMLVTAIDNLIRNAIEAGAVAHDLGAVAAPTVAVRVRLDGELALFEVEDNAGGPPAGFDECLFQPFATSKPKGIGLGLAMARRAVESQGGELTFRRTTAGSLFSIRLHSSPLGGS